ncbi:bifunctional hydroxymethylpyrimidine kinase/phosphomethylpyrimidine kinase [Nesterenkonia pannonica]|uniref:bifunctional hydroxymethylpyrimidine kinase/phosphomethylpyrimidine kinase n=1 Tax=Nesterenkonia pannonica TaxID=1548602 RepID=UPI0021647534|nr:bifunctional hydroxymethylpyrimidine kinase/phosphomethylpyrimidine kinase [Nesterenkonia pannonica]
MSSSAPAIPNVLSIASTDPTGGAGIQADLKSFSAFGAYGMCVVTALVAQNTQGVREIHAPPVSFLRAQLDAVSDDVRVDAVKTGMLGTASIIETITSWWEGTYPEGERPALVVDPVMIATSGDRLLEKDAERALITFLNHADLITPTPRSSHCW